MNIESLPTELRPTPALMKYYFLSSLLAGPFFLFPLVPLFARYRSLRYRIDQEGISMRWGVLFRREVSLNYARIQDIHLSSNLFERWLGLGKIQVQTASGSAGAEMTIEGLSDLDDMRDFLYSRMRGARGELDAGAGPEMEGPTHGVAVGAGEGPDASAAGGAGEAVSADSAGVEELTDTLREVAAELRAIREALGSDSRAGGSAGGAG